MQHKHDFIKQEINLTDDIQKSFYACECGVILDGNEEEIFLYEEEGNADWEFLEQEMKYAEQQAEKEYKELTKLTKVQMDKKMKEL